MRQHVLAISPALTCDPALYLFSRSRHFLLVTFESGITTADHQNIGIPLCVHPPYIHCTSSVSIVHPLYRADVPPRVLLVYHACLCYIMYSGVAMSDYICHNKGQYTSHSWVPPFNHVVNCHYKLCQSRIPYSSAMWIDTISCTGICGVGMLFIWNSFFSDEFLLFPLTSARLASLLLFRRPTLSLVLRQSYRVNSISFHLKGGPNMYKWSCCLCETPLLSDALLLFPLTSAHLASILLLRRPTPSLVLRSWLISVLFVCLHSHARNYIYICMCHFQDSIKN